MGNRILGYVTARLAILREAGSGACQGWCQAFAGDLARPEPDLKTETLLHETYLHLSSILG